MTACQHHEPGERTPAARFRFVAMLGQRDDIQCLCLDCSWEFVREWLKDPGDQGFVVHPLPIEPHDSPMMIQGGPR